MSHLLSGLVLCVFYISGLVSAYEPGRNQMSNYCVALSGKCQPICYVPLEVDLGKRHRLCEGELRCCASHPLASPRDSQHKSSRQYWYLTPSFTATSTSSPTLSGTTKNLSSLILHKLSTRPSLTWKMDRTTLSPPSKRQVLSFALKNADTKTDTSLLYYNNKAKSKGCGVPVLGRVRRIVGGTQAERCLFPWMVYISRDPGKDDLCGGTLVSSRHIVTAAHCFDYLGTNWPTLSIGEYNRRAGGSKGKFVTSSYKVSVHPDYSRITFSYDIAILRLNMPIPLEHYECMHPICLPDAGQVLKVGHTCTVAGWGSTSRTTDTPTVSSPSLMKTQINILEDSVCKNKYGNFFNGRSQICAGDLNGRTDSCVGDSGGPLMCSMTDVNGTVSKETSVQFLMGVISSGASPCAQPGTPALYTDMHEVLDWVQSKIKS